MRPRAVLLDALGTLLTFPDPSPFLRRLVAERHGVEVSRERARAAIGAEMAFYRANHDMASDAGRLQELRLRCAEILRDALELDVPPADLVATLLDSLRFEAFAEVAEVLDELRRRGHRLAVVSNWDFSLHEVLERIGLGGRFDVVVTSAELGVAKPDPAIFSHALAAVGADAGDAIHAGDSLSEDVAGARSAGVSPVLVCRGPPCDGGGTPVVADLRGLLEHAP